jgi:hypothetical protein
MLLEVLESVIFLEAFPFVEWHYAELANVWSPTLFIVSCRNTALPNRMLYLCMFRLHNFHQDMFSHINQKSPRGVHMRPAWGRSWWSRSHWVCVWLWLCRLHLIILSSAQEFATCRQTKWIVRSTIYKPQCNFLRPLYCFPKKRIIGQVLIGSVNSLHEHIILRNTNRLLYLSISPLNIILELWIVEISLVLRVVESGRVFRVL